MLATLKFEHLRPLTPRLETCLLAILSLLTIFFFFFWCGEHRLIKLWIYSCLVGEKIYRKGKPKLQHTSLLASVQISLWQSK